MRRIELTGFPGYYAGEDGVIYSSHRTGKQSRHHGSLRPLKATQGKRGYYYVSLKSIHGKYCTKDVHPLICTAFHGPKPHPKWVAAHSDGDKSNNRPDNLAWKSQSENLKDRIAHGTHDQGYQNSRAKLNREQCLRLKYLIEETETPSTEIAKELGLTPHEVRRIARGDRYPNLNIRQRGSTDVVS